MNYLSSIFSVYFRPFAVFGISFLLLGWGSANLIRYAFFVSAIQGSETIAESAWENVLAETDSIEDLLITFNYETSFIQPVEFHENIIAPNVLYSLTVGDGISVSGDAQTPTIKNTGVLSINGLGGKVTLAAGENITLVEEAGVLKIQSTDTNTDTDTKLTEEEVEAFVFDGESTGEFTDLQIGDILLSATGTSSTTSGSSLVGVYQGSLTTISGTDVQQILENIDATLSSLGTSSHAAITFAGSLDYLTLTGQQITLNQIDLITDVTGTLPVANGGTGAITAEGARSNLGLGATDTVGFGALGVGTTNPSYPFSIVASNPNSVTMSMQNTDNTGFTSIRYLNDTGTLSASFGYGNTGASKFKDVAYIQTYSTSTPIAFATNSTDRIFITGTGDVGVGTTTPSAKFQVVGNIIGSTLSDGTVSITSGNIDGAGNITAGGVITGTGSGITGLNATNLASGTVPSARVAGSYTGITGLGTVTAGTWQGTAINSTYLDTNVIVSSEIDTYTELNTVVSDVTLTHNGLIDTSAELSGIVGDETGSGALVFGTSPTFAGNIYLPGSGIWNSSGSVGIGTTNPGATLDVQGAAQFGSGNVDLINATGKIAAINTTYFASVDGSALTNLNASNLASGTVPSARVAGSYTGITGLGTVTAGTWQGTAISSTYLDTNVIISSEIDTYSELNTVVSDVTLTHNGLIDTSAELAAIVTNETGSGALVFGTSPTLTTPNIGAATGTSLSVTGAITSGGVVTGTGSGLTGLNASNLSSGTLPDARLTGTYTGLTSLTGSGTATFGTFSGSGASLTSLNATNLSSGTVASARLSGSYTGITGTGALSAGSISSGFGAINIGTSIFTGNGSGLTTLNASNLSSGTVASARISGSYTGITGVGTISAGTWQGGVIATAYLNGSVILSTEIDTSAELAAIVTNETGSGSLVFATSPTLTTPNIGAATGTSLDIGDGTVSAPAYSFSGDTNVGMYRIGTDILGLSTAGAERLRIDANGNVGIGTTSTTGYRLNVSNTGAAGINVNSNTTGFAVTTTGNSTQAIYANTTSASAVTIQAISKGNALVAQSDHSTYAVIYAESLGGGPGITAYSDTGYGVSSGSNFNIAHYAYRYQASSIVARYENTSNYCQVVPGGTGFTCPSDVTLKKNIVPIDNSLDKVMALKGVYYNWKTDSEQDPLELGFIAQEVEKIVPELIYTDPDTGIKSMGYGNLTPLLVNAVQEQQQIILTNISNISSTNMRLNETGEVLNIVSTQTGQRFSAQEEILERVNLTNNIQDTTIASQSASLQSITANIDSLEKMTNDTVAVVTGLQERISTLEQLFGMTTQATTAAAIDEEVLGVQSGVIEADSLIVTGDTNINNLGVTGDITAGLLSIKGFDENLATASATISTIAGPLKIQDQSAGNLEIMGGKVLIDTEGNIVVKGSVTVDKLNIAETNEDTKSIGEGTILEGENTAVVYTTSVTEKSKIFLIVRGELMPITVVEKKPGVSFTVKIESSDLGDVKFDWWVVN